MIVSVCKIPVYGHTTPWAFPTTLFESVATFSVSILIPQTVLPLPDWDVVPGERVHTKTQGAGLDGPLAPF